MNLLYIFILTQIFDFFSTDYILSRPNSVEENRFDLKMMKKMGRVPFLATKTAFTSIVGGFLYYENHYALMSVTIFYIVTLFWYNFRSLLRINKWI